MISYLKAIIKEFLQDITKLIATPAGDHIFRVKEKDDAKYLPEEQVVVF